MTETDPQWPFLPDEFLEDDTSTRPTREPMSTESELSPTDRVILSPHLDQSDQHSPSGSPIPIVRLMHRCPGRRSRSPLCPRCEALEAQLEAVVVFAVVVEALREIHPSFSLRWDGLVRGKSVVLDGEGNAVIVPELPLEDHPTDTGPPW